ncbi:M23 family metallopeptidase [Paenactinomyces guangxiensis]|uniref:M23 family metallopeptidase n=1 Tax=Paenactinomyces guangxiensis TaxID=1490290 RepID=A0A7W1WT97_9BACL|nr:M23 family metallopeptidase [Paenactinomyces guangxiensis]MBA4495668.1 M23 family metallopeptidase [Paenactinomyces guangxiensis]MBH8592656.1 M23 family metallopeptidase [Paenactinomyces guangxiensis]
MRKFVLIFLLLILVGFAGWYFYDQNHISWEKHEIRSFEVPGKLAPLYVKTANQYQLSWVYLASIDEVKTKYEKVNQKTMDKHARLLKKLLNGKEDSPENVEKALLQIYPHPEVTQMMEIADSYAWEAAPLTEAYLFPFRKQDRKRVSYSDSWGAGRTYGGKRKHEGTDLMAPKGTPLISTTDGEVVRKGWDRLGGWRLLIRDTKHPQIYYYYAHLSRYANGIDEGDKVNKGQVIGYVGDSGYGPEGMTGKFTPHLHFGIYVSEGLFSVRREAINPYSFLKVWDAKK